MTERTIDPDAFNTFEAAAWEERAPTYEQFFGTITSRLAEPLLDAASVEETTRVLDLATGPGYVAGEAARRGASVIAVDVAPAMVALARRLHPGLEVRQADAHALPFEDGSFDAVVGNFLILHLGRPEQAVAEFARVLAPAGKLALTAWDRPERARFIGVFLDAVAEVGATLPPDLPVGPDIFRFGDEGEFEALFRGQGLEHRTVATIAFSHRAASAREFWDGLLGGAVRTTALILGQEEETQRRIREAFDRRVEEFRDAEGLELPVSVKLASASKPS